jgi:hypothetical protein
LLDEPGHRRYVSHSPGSLLDEALLAIGAMDEQLKAQLMPPLVVFNLTLGAYLLFRFFTSKMFFGDFMLHLLIGAAIGLVTGGITLFFTLRKK